MLGSLPFRSSIHDAVKRAEGYSITSTKLLQPSLWIANRYPTLRDAESVLPKPMEILSEHEKYTSFRGLKDTVLILLAFVFLKLIERSNNFVKRLPFLGSVTDILNRFIAFAIPFLAEEPRAEKEKIPVIREFDMVLPKLTQDLIKHAMEYGVPPETLDWYHKVLWRLPTLSTHSSTR